MFSRAFGMGVVLSGFLGAFILHPLCARAEMSIQGKPFIPGQGRGVSVVEVPPAPPAPSAQKPGSVQLSRNPAAAPPDAQTIQVAPGSGISQDQFKHSAEVEDSRSLRELQQSRDAVAKAHGDANAANPVSEQFNPGAIQVNGSPLATNPMLRSILELMQNPVVQKIGKGLSAPAVVNGAAKLVDHPMRNTAGFYELGLFLFYLAFRAWRSGAASGFFGRVWVSIYSTCMYGALAVWIVPYTLFGEVYTSFAQGVVSAFQ